MATQINLTTGTLTTEITLSTGARGPQGVTEITTDTGTDITGILKGDGATVSAATANSDFQGVPEVKSASFTAENNGSYVVNASATVTDPSPVVGKGFTVFVRDGTATVGGTGYSTAGTVIRRVYHSGAWASYVYQDKATTDAAYAAASHTHAGTDLDYANTTEIGAALADADEVMISDGGGNTTRRKSALSRLWTYIDSKLNAYTAAGAWAFSSTTRPTSAGTGTPAATSLITLTDDDERRITSTIIECREDFIYAAAAYGESNWDSGSSGGSIAWQSFAAAGKPGVVVLTTGTATWARLRKSGGDALSGNGRAFDARAIIKLEQTTNCKITFPGQTSTVAANNFPNFVFDASVSANWYLAGTDTGYAATTDWIYLRAYRTATSGAVSYEMRDGSETGTLLASGTVTWTETATTADFGVLANAPASYTCAVKVDFLSYLIKISR